MELKRKLDSTENLHDEVEGLKSEITKMNVSEGEQVGQLLEKNMNLLDELASMSVLLANSRKTQKAPEESASGGSDWL
jgi:Mg2+ and Co2+ transporter CorA